MHPALVLWILGVPVFLSCSSSQAETLFDGRRLSIAPKVCTSSRYKDVIGTCMFNLECQERSGTVIGACVDRFLFGACCLLTNGLQSSKDDFESATKHTTTNRVDINAASTNTGVDFPSSISEIPKTNSPPTITTERWSFNNQESVYSVLFNSTSMHGFDGFVPTTVVPETSTAIESVPSIRPTYRTPLLGELGDIPFTDDISTILPFPLETFPSRVYNTNISANGNHHNLYDSSGISDKTMGYTTLEPLRNELIRQTEESAKLSTFMIINGYTSTLPSPIIDVNPGFDGENENAYTTSSIINSSPYQDTENKWPIGTKLETTTFPEPAESDFGEMDSDELFKILSANKTVQNSVKIKNDASLTTKYVHETGADLGGITNYSWQQTTPRTNFEPMGSNLQNVYSTTQKPWASSTYQVHTFKYSEPDNQNNLNENTQVTSSPDPDTVKSTTYKSFGGLVTWGDVVSNTKSTTINYNIHSDITNKPVEDLLQTWVNNLQIDHEPTAMATKTTTPTTLYTRPNIATKVGSTLNSINSVLDTLSISALTPIGYNNSTRDKIPLKNKNSDLGLNDIDLAMKPSSSLHGELEANLDDFVNQVVQGLAGSLDNLDLDEVMHQPAVSQSQSVLSIIPPTIHPLQILSDPLFPVNPPHLNSPPAPGKTSIGEPNKLIPKVITTTPTTTTTTPVNLDYKKDCGVRSLVKQGRIVGGTISKFGRWPWQALVREATWLGLFSKNKCGGVLISPKYVLTAAHCQPGFLATLTVVLGDFDLSSEHDNSNPNSVTKTVRRVIVHRDYNAQTFENDIALLELDSAVDYQPHIVPICLPKDMEIKVGQYAFVTGWGRLKYGGKVPQILHEVDVPILNNTDCQNMFLKSGHIKAIRESFICAGYADGAKDSCEGDSGGPLALQRPNGQWILAGTVSHGIKCAYPNLPGVYMRMTYYKAWIKRVTGINN